MEGDKLNDADKSAEWQERVARPTRGAKRGISEDEDEDAEDNGRRERDKRARKASSGKIPLADPMDVDEVEDRDEVVELKSLRRGKKRDRAEAGSAFGGDDDDDATEEDTGTEKARRRKRRTVDGKRKADAGSASARGKKRDRDLDEEVSGGEGDGESPVTGRVSKKKKGKKEGKKEKKEKSRVDADVSMEELPTPVKGRKIGDEWQINGMHYKIGPNGDRLRKEYVLQSITKFRMVRIFYSDFAVQ